MSNFASLSLSNLADAYNAARAILGEQPIKKFSDKTSAVTRVEKIAEALGERFGVGAVLTDDLSWKPAGEAVEENPFAPGGELYEEVAQETAKKRRGRELDLDMTQIIHPMSTNPKNKGSRANAIFALYRDGQTVAEFVEAVVAAGFPRKRASSAIRWDSARKFITLSDPE